MTAPSVASRLAAQRKAVAAARSRLAFEILVLRRLETRAGEGRRTALSDVLARALARGDGEAV